MSNVVNLYIDQGTDYLRTMTIVDINNTPLNLNNYNAFGQIRKNYTTAANTQINVAITDSANGKMSFGLTNSQTTLLTDLKYVYDIDIESPDNKIYRILEGTVIVSPSVTQ